MGKKIEIKNAEMYEECISVYKASYYLTCFIFIMSFSFGFISFFNMKNLIQHVDSYNITYFIVSMVFCVLFFLLYLSGVSYLTKFKLIIRNYQDKSNISNNVKSIEKFTVNSILSISVILYLYFMALY